MKALAAGILFVLFISASLTGWHLYAQPDSAIVGGVYIIHAGQVVSGDLTTWFAQVTLEDGARVQGSIRSFSSVLDIGGKVDGSLLAFGSDIIVRGTAELAQQPRSVETFPYVVLLPRMARAGGAASTLR